MKPYCVTIQVKAFEQYFRKHDGSMLVTETLVC